MAPSQLSERDVEILSAAFQAQKDPSSFKVDLAKLAELGGFKNTNSAGVSWAGVRKKIMSSVGSSDTPADGDAAMTPTKDATPKPKKPRAPRKSKGAAAAVNEEDGNVTFGDNNAGGANINAEITEDETSPIANAGAVTAKAASKKRAPKSKVIASIEGGEGATSTPTKKRRIRTKSVGPEEHAKRMKVEMSPINDTASLNEFVAKSNSSTDVELSEEAKAAHLAAEKFHYIGVKEDGTAADQNSLDDQLFNQQLDEKSSGQGVN